MDVWKAATERARTHGDVLTLAAGQPSTPAPAPVLRAAREVIDGHVLGYTETLGIATGATNHNTRHPVVTASFATTMHRLTGGRFALGLGRGIDRMFDAYGMPRITTAQVEDFVGLMRRLWKGEVIVGHDGPVNSLCLTPGGARLVTGGDDHTVRIWDTRTWEARHVLRKHTAYVREVAAEPVD